MALPQQVINSLSREPAKTPGWSSGLLIFSGGIFFFALLVYFGLTLGYEPYLASQTASTNGQIATLAQSISAGDQGKLLTFYSEITNIQSTLANHVIFSQFLSWLETNTEANVSYTSLSFSAVNQISLAGVAATEADVNEQLAIFEASPDIISAAISTVSLSPSTNTWQFNITLVMNTPSVLRSQVAAQ